MAKHKIIKPKDRKTALQVSFGKMVRVKRLEKELSQEEVADLADLHHASHLAQKIALGIYFPDSISGRFLELRRWQSW